MLKEDPFGSITIDDTNIRGKIELNQLVDIVQGKNFYKGVIQYIKDCSTYTVGKNNIKNLIFKINFYIII